MSFGTEERKEKERKNQKRKKERKKEKKKKKERTKESNTKNKFNTLLHRISGVPYTSSDTAIIVKEGDNLKLTCAATGMPKPQISWNRMDGNAIPDGAWRCKLKFCHFYANLCFVVSKHRMAI